MRFLVLLLGALLLSSAMPLVHAEPSGSATAIGQQLSLTPEERGRALLQPLTQLLSGSSAFAITAQDFRLSQSDSQTLGGPGTQNESPVLQAAAAALVPFRSPTQKFSRNLLLTRDLGLFPFQTEPSIATDPKNPDHIVVGVIDYNSPNVVSYVSMDRGGTWQGPYQPRYPDKDIGAGGDPTVVFDKDGNVYISSISIGFEEFSIGGIAYQVDTSSISVARSTDGGSSWGTPFRSSTSRIAVNTTAVSQGIGGTLRIGFLDKPWMSVGPSKADPSKNSVYVTYTDFVQRLDIVYILQGQLIYFANPVLETTIELVHSEDGGQTWSRPVAVSPTVIRSFSGQGNTRIVQGSESVVAPDGTVYASWFDSTDDGEFKGLGEIWTARSDDGGNSFQQPVLVDEKGEPPFSPRTANFRAWSSAFPQIAVGPKGEVSLAYVLRPSDKPTDDGDVFFATSTDRGQTWAHKRVNDDGTSTFQFFPALAYDPKGSIHLMWGDFRDDKTEKAYNIYYSKSDDGGKTWSENARVTDFPSNPNRAFPRGAFIGDYFSIKAIDGDAFMVWSDSRLGEFGSPNQKIGFARISQMKSQSIFVSPPRGAGGSNVEIQGFGFQPELEFFVSVSGNIVTSGRTDKGGRFDFKIFVPIAGEGAQDITVFDASGNAATASFFMDVGFNTIYDRLSKALQALTSGSSLSGPRPGTNSTSASLDSTTTAVWIAAGASVAALVIAVGALTLVLRRLPRLSGQ